MMSSEPGKRSCDQCGATDRELIAVDQENRAVEATADATFDYCVVCLAGIRDYEQGQRHASLVMLQRAAQFAIEDGRASEDDLRRALEQVIQHGAEADVVWT